ncbi:MAG: cya [Solirubrobacterales bacterium]|nr:cya [Solirubrobacterales bacterium]
MKSRIKKVRRTQLLAGFAAIASLAAVGTAAAALQGNEGSKSPQVLIGADDDNVDNGTIQPIPAPPDQSLKKTDLLNGGLGPDTIVGRLGSDVIKGGGGGDVLVGGTEGGQPAPALPNSDIAYGEAGSDAFIWAPGDGSDAFIGGDAAKPKKKKVKKGVKRKVKKPKAEVDTLVIGNLVLTGESSTPQLFDTKFGSLPRVFSSDKGVPTSLGGTPPRNPNLTGLCEIVAAPPGLGFNYLVRFFGAPGNLAVTIRTKGVEQVVCPTSDSENATLTSLGKNGSGPVQTQTVDFTAAAGSKLAAFVK